VFGLFFSLALLGLAAIDPIGIAAMPILLTQNKPYARSFTFLGGSFVSLMVMGFLFARGFGVRVLRFENTHAWLVPGAEALAGLVLLGIAGTLLWRVKTGRLSVEPSDNVTKRLRLGGWQLFILGAVIVAVQSIVDVVFVIAMIRVGQIKLSNIRLLAGIAAYAIAALVLQLAVVAAYRLAPQKHRLQTLDKVHRLLARYANQSLIGVSLVLGCALLVLAATY
jgi:hypothetical protein